MTTLAALLAEVKELSRNSTTGALDDIKRTRGVNRVLQDLQDIGNWKASHRTNEFDLIDGISEYSLQNYVGCMCLDNDGSTSILDVQDPDQLRLADNSQTPFDYRTAQEVRNNIGRRRQYNQYGIENGMLIINYPRQLSVQLHNCDSLTANGTVVASGDATNLTIDEVIRDEGNGSLNFDVSAGTSLIVTITGISAKDLTDFQNNAYLTIKAWLPTITNFTNIAIRWGSSASDYWEKTETVPAGNRTLAVGKNTFAFKWADATETGTPDVESVDYLRIAITFSSAITDTDFRLDDIRVGKAVAMEFDYWSKAMVRTASGAYQLEFNADTEVIYTDELLEDGLRRTVTEGGAFESFRMIGGKEERDRSDTERKTREKYIEARRVYGQKRKLPGKTLNFPGRR